MKITYSFGIAVKYGNFKLKIKVFQRLDFMLTKDNQSNTSGA